MPYVYWYNNDVGPRTFHTAKGAVLKECMSWGLPEGSCKVVGTKTFMHLPDGPIATIKKADPPPKKADAPPPASGGMYESDLRF